MKTPKFGASIASAFFWLAVATAPACSDWGRSGAQAGAPGAPDTPDAQPMGGGAGAPDSPALGASVPGGGGPGGPGGSPVPEPSTIVLLGTGLLGLVRLRRRPQQVPDAGDRTDARGS